jgi:hypothetical protein
MDNNPEYIDMNEEWYNLVYGNNPENIDMFNKKLDDVNEEWYNLIYDKPEDIEFIPMSAIIEKRSRNGDDETLNSEISSSASLRLGGRFYNVNCKNKPPLFKPLEFPLKKKLKPLKKRRDLNLVYIFSEDNKLPFFNPKLRRWE